MRNLVIALGLFAFFATFNMALGSDSGKERVKAGTKTLIGDSLRGEALYKASCIVCHGAGATGGVGPRLAANPILLDDQAFWKIVNQGRHVMPPLNGNVSDQQIADIRAWLRTIP
jgi:mono/diheme cytochrome c family protein